MKLLANIQYIQVANLVARWRLVQPLVSDLLPTDLRPSDSYLVLAAHLLWDLWNTTWSSKHFLRATTILQMGVTSSPSNWQMKLLLIRLYNRYLLKLDFLIINIVSTVLDVGLPPRASTVPWI